jgi:glycosyltransferase involved in cell wall biosynthesis
MRSLRILLSVHAPLNPNSGAAGAVLAVAHELRQQGHTVEICSFDDLPRWVQRLPTGILVRLKPLIFPWWLWVYVGRRARQFDVIDLLTGDGWLLFTVLRWTSPARQRPLLITSSQGLEHAYYEDLKHLMRLVRWSFNPIKVLSSIYDTLYTRYWNLWQVKRSLQLADLCFFLNTTEAALALQSLSLGAKDIRLSPNGLPLCLLNLPRPQSVASGKIGIAQIASFTIAKGWPQSIAALTEVMLRDQRVFLKLLGTGRDDGEILSSFPSELRHRIQNVRNYERCQLRKLLQDCELTVFSSITEGFGMGLLEAMACHLAPVSTVSAGPTDIITTADEGILVPVGDAVALRDAMLSLLEDGSLREEIRRGAFQRAQAFPWTLIVSERARAYLELLAERSRSSSPASSTS